MTDQHPKQESMDMADQDMFSSGTTSPYESQMGAPAPSDMQSTGILVGPSAPQVQAQQHQPQGQSNPPPAQGNGQSQTNNPSNTQPRPPLLSHHTSDPAADNTEGDESDHPTKKPRLRLAHACDRCRRRKIKCDTQHPCGPCKATGNVCTFDTPSRRMMKKREREESDALKLGQPGQPRRKSSNIHPIKRPSHSSDRGPSTNPNSSTAPSSSNILPNQFLTSNNGNGNSSAFGQNLEARLNHLEAMLRNVPPGVHNALISKLDGELAVGPGSISTSGEVNGITSNAELDALLAQLGSGVGLPGNVNMTMDLGQAGGRFGSMGNDFGNQNQSGNGESGSGNVAGPMFGGGGGGGDFTTVPGSFDMPSGSGNNNNNSPFPQNLFNMDPQHRSSMNGMNNAFGLPNIIPGPSTFAGSLNDTLGVGAGGGGFQQNGQGQGIGMGMDNRNTSSELEDVERGLQGLNLSNGYLYVDEIGQTKWQGATSGFPLLDLLTAAPRSNDEDIAGEPSFIQADQPNSLSSQTITNPFEIKIEPASMPDSAIHSAAASPDRPMTNGSDHVSTPGTADTGTGEQDSSKGKKKKEKKKEERFFPDRAPRPSQMLNPEATWRVITNVIPSDLMDTLVRCYLSTSHLLWPFLHVPSFLRDYADPQKWAEPGFACFVVAVCTLSSRHVDDPRVRAKPDDPSTAGKQYFELFKRLRDLPSADRPTLYSIQAAFLAAIFAFGLGTLSKAFSLLAESVTLCLDGGLHRSVEGYDHFNLIEQEMRKRTFWSIYSWDKQSAALFGRPPIIHLRDCDVPEPLQVDDDYITKDKILDQPPGHQTRLSAFVAVIRLHVVLEGVIDSCVTPSTFAGSSFLARAASVISRRSVQASLVEEEALLEEWASILPKHWHYDAECVESKDPIRITQAERLHCLEHLVRMIINRHRFAGFVQAPPENDEERARHLKYCRQAMDSALTICANHVHISQRGMMTYYGVHVIHQLAQAGRTLVAVILNCKSPEFSALIAPATEGLRSCVGLLRRFSGRYLCGLRSADIIEEFCRICHIPVETPRANAAETRPSPAWLRPVQRRSPSPAPAPRRQPQKWNNGLRGGLLQQQVQQNQARGRANPNDFNNQDLNLFFTEGLDNPTSANALLSTQDFFDISAAASPANTNIPNQTPNEFESRVNYGGVFDTLGPASAPYDQFESLEPDTVMADVGGEIPQNAWDVPFAPGNDVLGNMSASTILQLMRQGTFSQSWGS